MIFEDIGVEKEWTHTKAKREMNLKEIYFFFFFIVKRILKFFAFYIFLKIIEKIFRKKMNTKKLMKILKCPKGCGKDVEQSISCETQL